MNNKILLLIFSFLLLYGCSQGAPQNHSGGDIRYKGNPVIDQTISGSGGLEKVKEENSDSLRLEDFDLSIAYPKNYSIERAVGDPKYNQYIVKYFFRGGHTEELLQDPSQTIEPKDLGFALEISTPESIEAYIKENQGGKLSTLFCPMSDLPECLEMDVYKMQKKLFEGKDPGPSIMHEELKTFNKRNYLVYNSPANPAGEISRVYTTFIDDVRIKVWIGWFEAGGNTLHTYDKEADELFKKILFKEIEN